jgi:hypothetical protein
VVEHPEGGFTVQVAVTITNDATRSGSEVVQAYIAKSLGSSDAALLTLVGFTKAQVDGESTAKLSVTVRVDELPEIICLGANADPSSHLPIIIRSE